MNSDLDQFVKEKVVPFHLKNVEALTTKHPHIIGMANSILANKDNRAAIRITDKGKVIGEYTFQMDGLKFQNVDTGVLNSQFEHPFLGKIKPFVTVERAVLEKILADDVSYLEEPFSAVVPYLSELTIQFLP